MSQNDSESIINELKEIPATLTEQNEYLSSDNFSKKDKSIVPYHILGKAIFAVENNKTKTPQTYEIETLIKTSKGLLENHYSSDKIRVRVSIHVALYDLLCNYHRTTEGFFFEIEEHGKFLSETFEFKWDLLELRDDIEYVIRGLKEMNHAERFKRFNQFENYVWSLDNELRNLIAEVKRTNSDRGKVELRQPVDVFWWWDFFSSPN